MEIYELTEHQLKAFKALKSAANKCYKLKIGFFNVLDTTFAYNKDMIEKMDVDADHEIKCSEFDYPHESMPAIGGCSFADDQNCHSIKLTPKGRKVFIAEQYDDFEFDDKNS